MSTIIVRISDRPPEGRRHDLRGSRNFGRVLRGAAWSLFLLSTLAAGVLAQDGGHPRIDPGAPPQIPGGPGSEAGWQVVTIPGLPAMAKLGDIWVAPNGDVFVWANYPSRVGGINGEPAESDPEGERLPNPGGSNIWSAKLYHFNGTSWTSVLTTPGEMGNTLYGTDAANVFASTNRTQGPNKGETRLYKLNGGNWANVPLPGYYMGQKHTLAGVPGDLYFRVDHVIMHDRGEGLRPMYIMPGNEAPVRGLVYLSTDCVMMMCPDGHVMSDNHGNFWEFPATIAMGDVEDAWGTANAQGAVTLYAIGTDARTTGMCLWRFDETGANHVGIWSNAASHISGTGIPNSGCAMHMWGAAANDLYVTGVVDAEGHVLHFDGNEWTPLTLPGSFGAIHGVSGKLTGTTWFSTEEGKLIRYQRPNRAPDVTRAVPSVDRLWPADNRMVPVDLLGIVDPEGDAVSLHLTSVTTDEYPATRGVIGACPDAIVNGAQVLLRAEHAENGDGRTYAINFTAVDRLGTSSNGSVHVCAPHSVNAACDPDPVLFDATGPCAAIGPLQAMEVPGGMQIRYELAEAARIHLGVYDLAGRLRATVEEGFRASGAHEAMWATSALSPGVYFVKLRAGTPAFTRRFVVLR